VQSDTDSIFVKTEMPYADIENTINTVIIPRWLKHFGKTTGTLKFKYEGTFRNLFVLTKKRYIGHFVKSGGEEKLVKKGIEVVRSDATKFQEVFQEKLLNKILNEETKESIIPWIKESINQLRTTTLTDISFPCKLSQRPEDYKTTVDRKSKDENGKVIIKSFEKDVPIHVRALRNSKLERRVGEDYYWAYVVATDPKLNVIAFDELTIQDLKSTFEIDWKEMENRNIWNKVEDVFEAMNWDINEVRELEVKVVKEKSLKIKSAEIKTRVSLSAKKLPKPDTTNVLDAKGVCKNDGTLICNIGYACDACPHNECPVSTNVLPIVDISQEQTFKVSHSFKTKADVTERTIMVAEAFGLGIDEEKEFQIYDNLELKVKRGDIIYVTGDSGSGKSWILKNVFAKMTNAISIDELEIDENEVVVEGVGKNLNDALMKLNIAGLGDAFLYLRKYCQLSDGQKYRYRIAKFIDQEDKNIWILDEFCATLDRVTAKVVAYNLQKIARKLSKTVIVATTHTDLLNEIRPTIHLMKGYESDIVKTYYEHSNDWGVLSFYKDIKVSIGDKEDYEKLKKFHYRQAATGAVKKIYKCTFQDELIGVIMVCYPHLALKGRNIALDNRFSRMTKENCQQINEEIDYVARVIIHPKYRGIGLSQYMLKEYFKLTDARYVETLAVMARYNPFFEKAGMTRIDIDIDSKREDSVRALEEFGFSIDLISSLTYIRSVFNKLVEEDKNKVRELVISIINRYKGASHIVFAKINKNPTWKEDLKADDELLFEYFKQLRRANTVYLIKELKCQ